MPRLKPTQTSRLFAVGTALDEDKLLFHSMNATERLGRLFNFDLNLLSTDPDIKLQDVLGTNMTVRFLRADGETRYFNGYVAQFSHIGPKDDLFAYRAILRPWMWFLTRTSDCHIFQNITVPDIVKEIFRNQGFSNFEDALTETYREWEYCVQYRETDFDFVSRLMEQEGIYYYFKHENGKHTLVLSDSISAHNVETGYEEVPFFPEGGDERRERDHVSQWSFTHEVQPGAFALKDFDFKNPKTDLTTRSVMERQHAQAGFEIYDYPGEYVTSQEGNTYASTRLQELQAQYEMVYGQGNAGGLSAGCLFSLTNHGREDQNREYLIIAAEYNLGPQGYEVSTAEDGIFSINLTAIDRAESFRAPRTTPKPIVQGPQTAIVVGPSGEEIYTDEHGRVKVQFHWDRYSKADENSSCWMRVAQVWAGKKWGAMYIPRIGQEVIVEFLEGDPDRPIITGRVYNGTNKPPYDLPAEKTKSTLKSNSSKGGGGFNEIRLEDKKGDEQIFVHAEKDRDLRVKNINKEWIGNNKHLIVKNDQYELVEKNKHGIIKEDVLRKVEGNVFDTIETDRLEAVKGNEHLKVDGDRVDEIVGNDNLKVTGNLNEKIATKISTDAGTDIHIKAGMNYAVDSGIEVHIKGGMTVIIEAGMQLSLKAAGSFVDIGPAGVSISGPMVNINSGGSAGSGGGSSPTAPAAVESPDEPEEALVADDDKAGQIAEAKAATPPEKEPFVPSSSNASPFAKTMKQAAEDGTPFCEQCEKMKQSTEDDNDD